MSGGLCALTVSPFSSSPTRPAYCATDVVKRHQSKKKTTITLKGIKISENLARLISSSTTTFKGI